MAIPIEHKPPFARWLVAQRKARPGSGKDGVMTTAELREAIRVSRGFGMGHSTYAQMESGAREPTEEQYRHLTGFFGSEPEPDPEPEHPASDIADLAAAVREQTAAMRDLVDEMKATRDAQPDIAEVIARAVSAALQAAGVRVGS